MKKKKTPSFRLHTQESNFKSKILPCLSAAKSPKVTKQGWSLLGRAEIIAKIELMKSHSQSYGYMEVEKKRGAKEGASEEGQNNMYTTMPLFQET